MRAAATAPKQSDAALFSELRGIFNAHLPHLRALVDKPADYQVVVAEGTFRGRPLWVGGVRAGKSYTSFHFVPVYGNPELLRGMSPELKRRMQGKSCFNFNRSDPALFAELKELVSRGLAGYTPERVQQLWDSHAAQRKQQPAKKRTKKM